MPTYACSVPADLLDVGKRRALAQAISVAHAEATGAPAGFAQVVFEEKPAGTRFLGGDPSDHQVFVRGDIRAGRTTAQRAGLMQAIVRAVVGIAEIEATEVWVYLSELLPENMIEYGRVLPEPGDEQAWLDRLPQPLRDRLRANLGGDPRKEP